MDRKNIQLRRLGETDKIDKFDCGDEDLSYPALKICRLATNKNCHGEGIGRMIVNLIIGSYRKDNKAGCRFITVDAYADALPFYDKMGFSPLSKEDEGAATRLLYFDLESVSSSSL